MTPTQTVQLEQGYQRMRRETADFHLLLACPSPHPTWLRRVRQEVHLFLEDVAERCALIDADGFLQEVDAVAPNLHEQVRKLHDEQDRLIQELERMDEWLGRLAAQPSDTAEVCRRLGRFLVRLAAHESRKNQLVLDAFTAEPGAMD